MLPQHNSVCINVPNKWCICPSVCQATLLASGIKGGRQILFGKQIRILILVRMSPSPAVIPEVVERRMSDRSRNSSGFRDRSSSFQGGERRPSSVIAERIHCVY